MSWEGCVSRIEAVCSRKIRKTCCPLNIFIELQTFWYQVNLLICYFFHEANGYHSQSYDPNPSDSYFYTVLFHQTSESCRRPICSISCCDDTSERSISSIGAWGLLQHNGFKWLGMGCLVDIPKDWVNGFPTANDYMFCIATKGHECKMSYSFKVA